ncbi:MAG: hypothetical protein AAGC47_12565 [Bacteroidota bacterium]
MGSAQFKKEILELIGTKSKLKRDVFELSKKRFKELKTILREYIESLSEEVKEIDSRLEIDYQDLGDYYAQVTIAGDTLVFSLHTNVFVFPEASPLWTTSYLKNNEQRAYCATIQVYNFLADSVRFKRDSDSGYLLARLFLNAENHFFVEGKKELGLMFNNFMNEEFSEDRMMDFITAVIKHSISFDLFVPNYENVAAITLGDANKLKDNIALRTGKRLGFQFGLSEDSDVT